MNKNTILGFLLLLLVACHPDEPKQTDKTYTYSCVIVNMGNYSESNGSIALYNAATGGVEQEVYAKANGRNLASIIESATLHNDLLLLMCNNSDKLVILNSSTMKEVCDPITTIGVPRYAVVKGDYAYVSCWNKTNKQTGEITIAQHISKINLLTKAVVGSLVTTGQPEGMVLSGNTLFVASGDGLDVYDTNTDALLKHISSQFTQAEAQQVLIDKNNQVWLSMGTYTGGNAGGFMLVDAATLQITTQLPEPQLSFDGDIALSPTKDNIYFLYADGIVSGQTAEVTTQIYAINVDSYQESSLPIISGVGFYGFSVDPSTGIFYTANVNGFITNSMTSLYNTAGTKISEFMTGVGTSRFIFK